MTTLEFILAILLIIISSLFYIIFEGLRRAVGEAEEWEELYYKAQDQFDNAISINHSLSEALRDEIPKCKIFTAPFDIAKGTKIEVNEAFDTVKKLE